MKTMLTVQHTEAEHHLNGHIGAWRDWPLTPLGREQAFAIGKWLANEGCGGAWRMYVSPQLRARQTAEEINRTLSLTPLVREELKEVNAGQGNGQSREWYRANMAPQNERYDPDWRPFPDAESDRELWDRLYPFCREIMENREEKILVVSHGTTLSFLQSMLLGGLVEDRGRFRFSGRAGSLSRFTVEDDGRVTVRFINHSIY